MWNKFLTNRNGHYLYRIVKHFVRVIIFTQEKKITDGLMLTFLRCFNDFFKMSSRITCIFVNANVPKKQKKMGNVINQKNAQLDIQK